MFDTVPLRGVKMLQNTINMKHEKKSNLMKIGRMTFLHIKL